MHVAHVNASPGYSGGEVQVFLLLQGLRARGVDVTLYALPDSESHRRAVALGIPVVALAPRNAADMLTMWRLRHRWRQRPVDIVHLHSGHAIWLGSMAARPLGIPIVATKRMDRAIRPGLKSRLIWNHWVTAAVGISPAVVEHLRAAGVPDSRRHLICSVVDPQRTQAKRSRAAVRRDLKCPPDLVVLLAMGSLDHRKGIDVLLHACARWPPDAPPYRLWIAGDGPERPALERLAHSALPADRVHMLGHRSDAADLFQAADVCVMPSRAEGMGNTALEAMAGGRPVVASAVGGLMYSVVPEETGVLVPPDNPEALANALVRLVRDEALRLRLGDAARKRMQTAFTPDSMVNAYHALYQSLLTPRQT
ncbi:MAG: glycosyltransferase family 4 protein [Lentisphaerae bacterium]|nr:glycosyltransferase family 4 protein [Lentisphaerota bacterium]